MNIDYLRVSAYNDFEALSAFREQWDKCVESCGSDIYFTFDYLETWWRYYGRGRELQCFLLHRGDQPVAALPFFVESFGFAPFEIRVAKFVGADFTIPVFSPAIDYRYRIEILHTILEELLRKRKCDLVSFSPLSGTTDLIAPMRALCATECAYRIVRNDISALHTIFILPNSFDTYLGSLAKQTRSKFRRDVRNLSQKQNVTHRVVRGVEAADLFDAFVALHEDQWRAENKLGHFGDWPDSAPFTRALVEKLAIKDKVRLYELIVDSETISFRLGFTLADRYYARLPARKVGERWNKAGAGKVALVRMLEALIDENIKLVEAGPGHYDYKIRHGGTEIPLYRLIVSHNQALARVKTNVILLWSYLLHLVYYRLWFMRLAPRMKLPRKPLWRIWIRTRL
jgi:CelD/BcsL family acetyltransferase involved in cellulose biosynthesis